MAAIVQVARSSDYANQWKVALDGRYVVGFDGPDARDQAEQHRDVLEELLTWSARSSSPEDDIEDAPSANEHAHVEDEMSFRRVKQ